MKMICGMAHLRENVLQENYTIDDRRRQTVLVSPFSDAIVEHKRTDRRQARILRRFVFIR